MDFIEEKTPKGFIVKILLKSWKFLAFDKKGASIYADREGRSLLHTVPHIFFIGENIDIPRSIFKDYTLLKIRKGAMVLPYIDLKDGDYKYIFIQIDKTLDMVPVLLYHVDKIQSMVREYDANTRPDYVLVDSSVSANDIVIIKSRYKMEDVIYVESANNVHIAKTKNKTDPDRVVNLNMMSSNPVFLSKIHLESKEISLINQLLLDFELTALDTDYILFYINRELEKADNDEKHHSLLKDLRDNFTFYLHLLQRNDDEVRKIIEQCHEAQMLTPFSTLVSKIKSIYPGREEQQQYSEYDRLILEQREKLSKGTIPTS